MKTEVKVEGSFPDWCDFDCPGWDLEPRFDKPIFDDSIRVKLLGRTIYCKNEMICRYIMEQKKEAHRDGMT